MNIEELLNNARNERGQAVINHRVNLVDAVGEYKKLGGEEDYKSSLQAIVDNHGSEGVLYSLVREVLHDTEMLNAAVSALADAKGIIRGKGKRDFLLTTTKAPADVPVVSDENPETEDELDDDAPATTPVKPSKVEIQKTVAAK